MRKPKLNWNYPHTLSFAPDLWEWLQRKTNYNGIKIPLSRFIAKVLQDEMDKDPIGKAKAIKSISFRLKKNNKPNKTQKAKPKNKATAQYKKKQQTKYLEKPLSIEDWDFKVNEKSPLWVKNIAKQLEAGK